MSRPWLQAALLVLLSAGAVRADEPGQIAGHVTDPSGAALVGADVQVSGAHGARKARTNGSGDYSVAGLPPGSYVISIAKDGFAAFANGEVPVTAGAVARIDATLELAAIEESVTVKGTTPGLSLTPSENAGAIVIKGQDLDALPDDPDEMLEALQALAGPAAGPNGGQVFIDGFTGGRMPPKSSIREIRINANPFSAEYDRLGFGRIEVLTKPGTDKLRGETSYRFNDDSLNTRNPFAPNKPPYQRRDWSGNLSGPLGKKASFFVDADSRHVDDNQLINATVLDASLTPVHFSQGVVTPQRRTSVSPRLDWQITPTQTLTARYTYTTNAQDDAGIGGYSLASRGYDSSDHQHTLEATETAVFGKVVNETRLRYWMERRNKNGDDSMPTLQVLDAFTGGGASVGPSVNDEDRLELQNVTSWTRGAHALKAGFRLRTASEEDVARQGFGGSVLFASGAGPALDTAGHVVTGADGSPLLVPLTSIERYRRTLLLQELGYSPAQIRALGGGASQLTIVAGNPEAEVSQFDLAPFVQDDWKVRPDLLLSVGLRYEVQNNIGGGLDLAPRLAFAWSPGVKGGTAAAAPKTVIRGGFGVFYDRFGEDLTLRANRFDGVREQQFLVSDPAVLDGLRFDAAGNVSGLPSSSSLAGFAETQTTWAVSPDLHAPYTLQSSLSLERSLPHNFTLSGTAIASQGRRLLRSRNLNAPLPDGTLPLGAAAGNVYQMESTGRLNQYQLIIGVNNRASPRLTLFARYFLAWAKSDTDGVDSFPANPNDLASEYGPASIDVRHRFVLGGNLTGPWGLRLSPFVLASTGRPFNITLGRDSNGDGIFNDRPAFAADPSDPGAIATAYGLLDPNPSATEAIVERNLGEGPGFVMVNLRLSKTFTFGGQRGQGPGRGGSGGPGGPGGRGGFGGFGGRGGDAGGGDAGARGLTLSLSAQNVFNRTNAAAPVGNLGSPFFGESLASAGGFGFGAGGSTSAGNRRIELQARLAF